MNASTERGRRSKVRELGMGLCAHTYWEIDKFKVCMFAYVHICGKCVVIRRLCVQGRLSLQTCPRARQYSTEHNERAVEQREIKFLKRLQMHYGVLQGCSSYWDIFTLHLPDDHWHTLMLSHNKEAIKKTKGGGCKRLVAVR